MGRDSEYKLETSMILCAACGREARGYGCWKGDEYYLYCSQECAGKQPHDWTKAELSIQKKIAAEIDLGKDTDEIVKYILSRWFELAHEEAATWSRLRALVKK